MKTAREWIEPERETLSWWQPLHSRARRAKRSAFCGQYCACRDMPARQFRSMVESARRTVDYHRKDAGDASFANRWLPDSFSTLFDKTSNETGKMLTSLSTI